MEGTEENEGEMETVGNPEGIRVGCPLGDKDRTLLGLADGRLLGVTLGNLKESKIKHETWKTRISNSEITCGTYKEGRPDGDLDGFKEG